MLNHVFDYLGESKMLEPVCSLQLEDLACEKGE
jgi:hypothetical protein